MADISKCKGIDCGRKHDCYRYTATINPYRQSWFAEMPLKNGKCEMFCKHQIGRAVNTLLEDLDDIN